MKYPDFSEAILMCVKVGESCAIAKSDMSMAFRHAPLTRASWKFLILKCKHPVSGKVFFFVEKCLPFGSSISRMVFQVISDGIAFVMKFRIESKSLLNYLDDYFFTALRKSCCDSQVQSFLKVCEEIRFPVALEKTVWGTTILTFLGLLIDTQEQMVRVPLEKVIKALDMLEYFLNRRNKSVTVLQVQRLCGTLNFLTRCIIPGRVFLARVYTMTSNPNLKQFHHVRITNENHQDLMVWRCMLENQTVFNHPFLDLCNLHTSLDIDMYSDASSSKKHGGLGAYCGKRWTAAKWPVNFISDKKPSIEYLKLFALTTGVLLWIKNFKNTAICLYCDNESVKFMVNNTSAKCKNCMVLLRLIVLECMIHNVKLTVEYVATDDNGKADALSRGQYKRFRRLAPDMNEKPEVIPESIWPPTKIWVE